ncbi:hypothetical protein ACSBR2_032688 [Camellia fascicularis]
MQTMEIPRRVCDKMDRRLNGNFLWGETDSKKKVHLVNWDNVCKSKIKGGLGLRKTMDHNVALLTKLGWKMLSGKDKLWCEILHSKYLRKHSIFNWPLERSSSHTWKNIHKNRDNLKK